MDDKNSKHTRKATQRGKLLGEVLRTLWAVSVVTKAAAEKVAVIEEASDDRQF